MSGREAVRARRAIITGLALGVAADWLLRGGGVAGAGMFVLVAATSIAGGALQRRAGGGSAEASVWYGIALLCGVGFVCRDSPALKLLSLGCAVVALSLPALHAGRSWIRRGSPEAWVHAFFLSARGAGLGAALAVRSVHSGSAVQPSGGRGRRLAVSVLRGLALGTPLLVVFGGLFTAADPVFAGMVAEAVNVDAEAIVGHAAAIAFLSWAATGYLYHATTGAVTAAPGTTPVRVSLGVAEVCIAVGMLNLLFLAFLAVQFTYLFGGAALVHVTPGLTYAEYARRGFFELVFAVLLVVPLLLAADAVLLRRRAADDVLFRALAGTQIALVLGIAFSALERMRLYRGVYGLTEDRVYATAVLLLLVVILTWLAATVLRGRRRDFAFGAGMATLATLAALYALNPDALVARTNLARHGERDATAAAFDAVHAARLSADAVPVLVAALPALPDPARCVIARHYLRRWPPAERPPLRSWNRSDAKARAVVRRNEGRLTEAEASCGAQASAAQASPS